MATNAQTLIDVVPQIDVTGDFELWRDDSIMNINSKVNALLTLMEMERGTIPDFPGCGGREILNRIYFSTDSKATNAVEMLGQMAKTFLNLDITFSSSRDPSNLDKLNVVIQISNLPVTLSFSLVNNSDSNIVNIVDPSFV